MPSYNPATCWCACMLAAQMGHAIELGDNEEFGSMGILTLDTQDDSIKHVVNCKSRSLAYYIVCVQSYAHCLPRAQSIIQHYHTLQQISTMSASGEGEMVLQTLKQLVADTTPECEDEATQARQVRIKARMQK
jgi:hypothetical protein